jgi:hypothetical protein
MRSPRQLTVVNQRNNREAAVSFRNLLIVHRELMPAEGFEPPTP